MFVKKMISIVLVVGLIACMFVGCGDVNTDTESYDDYSYGLEESGLYKNLDQYDYDPSGLYSLSFTCEEVLEWGFESSVASGSYDIETVDDYVYSYGEELLAYMGLTAKEDVEEGDIVSVSLEFAINGEKLEDYSSTDNYEASAEGDSIVSSFIGHKINDVYNVEYVFPEDADEHASEIAIVTVTINNVSMQNPIGKGVVDANLETINEVMDGITDTESYLLALRPLLASATLDAFVENYLQTTDVQVPDEFVGYETYRLKARLKQIGYTYQDYLSAVQMTDDEIREYCAMVARENYMIMKMYVTMDDEINDDDIIKYYGDGLDSIKDVQGAAYMKLNMIRDLVLYEIASNTKLIDANGNAVEFIGSVEDDMIGDVEVAPTDALESTETINDGISEQKAESENIEE